jgi:DNA end-binding protein Ku
VLLDEDEIEAAKVESRRTLDLVQFVDAGEIDVFYFDNPYYVVPADELAEEAFIVLREALRQTRKIGLGQLSVRGREYLVSLKPCGKGIVLETLRYEDEVRKAQGYFKEIPDSKPSKDMVDLAKTLIEQKTAPFDAGEFHDRYVEALEELIAKKAKAKGKKILEDVEEPETARGSNVIDLMAALKKSVGPEKGGAKAKPAAKKGAAGKASAKKAEPKARKRA